MRRCRPGRPFGAALLLLLLVVCVPAAQRRAAGETLIVVSFDGWRWDYDRLAPAPHVQRLAARGVRAAGLIPAYPSKTFPNHYTIVTGLSPAHHGIVANTVRDPETGRVGRLTASRADASDPHWWGGEPIWVTAERAGRRTGSIFWPGSEAPIAGVLPRDWRPFDDTYPAAQRIAEVLGWLDRPAADRPALVLLYFSDVDAAGHDHGPGSRELRAAVTRVDGYLGALVAGLEARRLLDRVNLVVLSDHGMEPTDMQHVVVVDDYVTLFDDEVVDINPTLGIAPRPGREAAILRALATAHPRLRVYRRDAAPVGWGVRGVARVPAIVGLADPGWQVVRRRTLDNVAAGRTRPTHGQHGYEPSLRSMRGLFVAAGPAFRRGATVPAFENVHVYAALAAVLGITPAPNDGDPAIGRRLLR